MSWTETSWARNTDVFFMRPSSFKLYKSKQHMALNRSAPICSIPLHGPNTRVSLGQIWNYCTPLVFHIAWPSSPWVAVVVGALGCKPLDNPLVRGPWACNMKQNKSSEASSRYQSHWLMLWHVMTSNNGHACVIPLYLEPWTNFKRLPPFQCCWCRCRAWWPCEQCAYAIHCNTM